MPIKEREILQLLIAHIETDETLRPDELPLARRLAGKFAPTIARLVRDEIATAKRAMTVAE